MKYDLDHLSYTAYLAEKHYKNKEALYSVRETVNESADLVSLQEANLTEYLGKMVGAIQKVWNKFKESVTNLYNDVKFENLKNMKDYGTNITLKQGDKVPNLNNLNTLVKLAPIPYNPANNNIPDTVNEFLKQSYPNYFNDISDKNSAVDIANQKSFTIAQDNQQISYNANGNIPGTADMYKFLSDYKNNTMASIKVDIDNINKSIKAMAGANQSTNQPQNNQTQQQQNTNNNQAQTSQSNTNNQSSQQQATAASFQYNTSYGSLFMEADGKQPPATTNNNTTNVSTTTNNNTGNTDEKKKKSNKNTVFMKTVTKLLSIKLNEANKTRFLAFKYCNEYMKTNGKSGGENDQVDLSKIKEIQ